MRESNTRSFQIGNDNKATTWIMFCLSYQQWVPELSWIPCHNTDAVKICFYSTISVLQYCFFFNLFQLKLKQINSEHALKSHLTGPEMFAYFLWSNIFLCFNNSLLLFVFLPWMQMWTSVRKSRAKMEESALIQTVDTHAHVPTAGKEQFAIRVKTLFKSKSQNEK